MSYSNIDTPYSHLTDSSPAFMDTNSHMDNSEIEMDNESMNINMNMNFESMSSNKPTKDKKKAKYGIKKSNDPEIEILEIKKDTITFELSNCDLSFANALRRVMIAEVPTMAFDFVDIYENSTVLDDEFIAHRLGLIPLYSMAVENFKYARDCTCEEGCIHCSVDFTLDMENTDSEPILVTQRHIFNITRMMELGPDSDEKDNDMIDDAKMQQINNCDTVVPVGWDDGEDDDDDVMGGNPMDNNKDNVEDDPIILVKLGPNQRLKFRAVAKKGIGKEHAKFQPVTVVGFIQQPDIWLNIEKMDEQLDAQKKEEFVNTCPARVYAYDEASNQVKIENVDACLYCNECIRKAEEFGCMDIVKIRTQPGRFILTVETTGALEPISIVLTAFDVLVSKLKDLRENLKALNM